MKSESTTESEMRDEKAPWLKTLKELTEYACDGYALDPRPWWKRLADRCFPSWHGMLPDLPEWAEDGIVIETRVNFSFVDRLRILLTGNLSVKTWTACENFPGRVETQSSAKPTAPNWCA